MTRTSAGPSSKRIIEPIDRVSEVLFGLIMVLTFTGSLSAAEAGRQEIRTMLIGALGCNLAWGIIDGIFYLMGCLSERARDLHTVLSVRRASSPESAHRTITGALPSVVASTLQPAELERVRLKVLELPDVPAHPRLSRQDWLGAIAVFLCVFLSTFPVVLPFIFMQNAVPALRISNLIAIALLFITGYSFGRSAGLSPWRVGLAMVIIGAVLVAMTIALGG